MKAIAPFAIALLLMLQANAQQMTVKKPNFSSFKQDAKRITKVLLQKSSPAAKQHPEFGVLPYNAQCSSCMELIDKRTADSRLFIDPNNERHTYSQKSYFPLHYKKSADDVWHTIDKRLRPDASNSGVYVAANQPVPTKCDLNRQSTSLTLGDFEFEFNKGLSMYYFDETSAYTKTEAGNYSDYTVGEEGLKVKNIWAGMDMQQVFSEGRIKTNYVINAPLNIPVNGGWMVIEDHFTLPDGYSCVEAGSDYTQDGYYTGDYAIRNQAGQTLVTYQKPIYIDAKAYGMHGYYKLLNKGNDYTLQMLVPVSWLKSKDNEYPIFIDPTVMSNETIGSYESSGNQPFQYGFTTESLGSCNDTMSVDMPAHSTVLNAYVDFEYELTYSTTCGAPPEPAPYCTFSQITQHVICNPCGTTSPVLGCSPANPPYTGICTTDSNLVAGAGAVCITTSMPTYLSCIQPHPCNDYSIPFTLVNQDSICGDVCGYLCAVGHMWSMTVEGMGDSVLYPVITPSSDSLISLFSTGNQWYRNDTAMDGDTSGILVITMPGTYFDVIANVNGCAEDTSTSFTFPFDTTYIPVTCEAYFVLTPSPGDTGLYVGYNESVGGGTDLWTFGDGDTSTSPWPNHYYDSAGYYNICLTVSNDSCTNTYCDSSFYAFKTSGQPMNHIIIYNPTAINQVQAVPAVNIFPNPATNVLMIKASNMHATNIIIYDMAGRKVLQQRFVPELDISLLSQGIYLIEITGPEGSVNKRLVKM